MLGRSEGVIYLDTGTPVPFECTIFPSLVVSLWTVLSFIITGAAELLIIHVSGIKDSDECLIE